MISIDVNDEPDKVGILTWTLPPKLAETIESLPGPMQKIIVERFEQRFRLLAYLTTLATISSSPRTVNDALDSGLKAAEITVMKAVKPPGTLDA